ncbi:MAG: VWA domain-containing protein, partial [Caldilineaceae bacterium]|nr:VWA domain-containing protein [Caldilineaceae bacterium]
MLALLGFILVILGSTAVRPVAAAEGNLPGGTSLTVELTGPADAAVIPAGTDSLAVAGTASIGQGPTLANTLIVYVLDVSGSVNTVGEGCGGDANGDGRSNTVLDCEIVAAQAVNADARAAGSVGEVGAVTFSGYSQMVTNPPSAAVMGDLSPAAGVQTLVPPAADVDGLNGPDVEEALASALVRSGGTSFYGLRKFTELSAGQGSTDYHDGIAAALQLVNASTMPNKLVIFMSDGAGTTGENVSTLQSAVAAGGAVIHSFAVGSDTGFDCTTNSSGRGSLRDVANLSTPAGTCTNVASPADLPNIVPDLIQAQLTGLSYTMDDGAPQDLSSAVTPALPQTGPAGVSFSTTLPLPAPGSHTLCV